MAPTAAPESHPLAPLPPLQPSWIGPLEPWLPAGAEQHVFAPPPSPNADRISSQWPDVFLPAHPELAAALKQLQDLNLKTRRLPLDKIVGSLKGDPARPQEERNVLRRRTLWKEPGVLERLDLLRALAEKTLGLEGVWPFQLAAALGLLQQDLVEMANGAGKSLAAVLAGLAALPHFRSVHFVTLNDYLAERDAQRAAHLAAPLGLSTFVIYSSETPELVAAEYAPLEGSPTGIGRRVFREGAPLRDFILQGPLVFGRMDGYVFAYLHQHHLETDPAMWLRPPEHFLIADEADEVLIDNLIQPYQITAPTYHASPAANPGASKVLNDLVDALVPGAHHHVAAPFLLTDLGLEVVTGALGVDPYSPSVPGLALSLRNALYAKHALNRGDDYVVERLPGGTAEIILLRNGRLQYGTRYSAGLHEALMVREGLPVSGTATSQTGFSISLRSFVNLYGALAGMTATAQDDRQEYADYYGSAGLVIPSWDESQRALLEDVVLATQADKSKMLLKTIAAVHKVGRPILVACSNRTEALALSRALRSAGVPCAELLAENHRAEAPIIAAAGQLGSVTVSAGMAGRGTDIRVSPQAAERGGLFVIGTLRSTNRRDDEHLKGRAGRHGLPGTAVFYVSLEDELMRMFGSERIQGLMNSLGLGAGETVEARLVTGSIRRAQRTVKAQARGVRRQQVEFSDALEPHQRLTFSLIEHTWTCLDVEVAIDRIVAYAVARWMEVPGLTDSGGRLKAGALEQIRDRTGALADVSRLTYVGERVTAAELAGRLHREVLAGLRSDWPPEEAGIVACSRRRLVARGLRSMWTAYHRAAQHKHEEMQALDTSPGLRLARYLDWCAQEFHRSFAHTTEEILRALASDEEFLRSRRADAGS